jgi:hypothetical protein
VLVAALGRVLGYDGSIWPHRDGFIRPHLAMINIGTARSGPTSDLRQCCLKFCK